MRRSGLVVLALSIVLVILGPFQNCSVYQSEDRVLFEERTREVLDFVQEQKQELENSTTAAQMSSKNHCKPYLTADEAQAIFEQPVSLKFIENVDSFRCQIRTTESIEDDPVFAGLKFTDCRISPFDRDLALNPLDYFEFGEIIADPNPNAPLSGGSFGYVQVNTDRSVFFQFIGAREDSETGASCSFTFSTEPDFEQVHAQVLSIASQLVHLFASNAP